jgi:hypothetical protein
MDCDTLDAHARWAHPLSAADERKLARLKSYPHLADVAGLIDHMLRTGIKLEQEAVRVGRQAVPPPGPPTAAVAGLAGWECVGRGSVSVVE